MKRTASQDIVSSRSRKKARYEEKQLNRKSVKMQILSQMETKMYPRFQNGIGGDQFWNNGPYPDNGYNVHPPAQGDDYNQYVGLRITPFFVKVKWNAYFQQANGAAPSPFNKCLAVLFQWKGVAPSGPSTIPSVNNLLETGGAVISPLSGWDFPYRDNIRILRVSNFTLDQYHPTHTETWKVKRFPVPTVRYTDPSGDVADGGVYITFVSDATYPSTGAPWIEFYSQMFFKDA